MKLYAFQPDGHGQYSFFTMAASEKQARKIVDQHIKEHYFKNGRLSYEAEGWGTDYYLLTVVGKGEVILNDNS